MGAITIGNAEYGRVKAADGRYVGDTPPAGAYHVTTGKTWMLKETKSGDTMITVPLNITETGKKAKYNGFTIWHNLVLGKTSIPYVNMFLEAAGIDPAKFHGGKAKTDDNGRIVAIKGISIAGNELIVATRKKKDGYEGLDVTSAAPYHASDSDDDDDEDDFDSDEDEAEEIVSKTAAKDDDDDDADDDAF